MSMSLFTICPSCFHILVFLLFFMFALFLVKQNKKGRGRANLPPTPPRLPIIGNLHQIGKLPHQSLQKLSQKHGQILLLQLGSIPTVVISSAHMAEQIKKTHDLACCSRPLSPGPKKLSYNYLDVAFCPYNNHWKQMRKFFVSELLSSKRMQSFKNAREEEVNHLITSISSAAPNPVNLNKKIFALADGIIGAVAFGKSYRGKQFKNKNFQHVLDEALDVFASFAAEDLFPWVGRMIDALTGLHAKLDKSFCDLDGFLQMVLDEHLDPARPKSDQEDLVDALVRLSKEQTGDLHITTDNIKALLMDTFLAGIDTSSVTMVWAMSELVKNPRVLNKVQTEIRGCSGMKLKLEEDDVGKLKYLRMVVKETLRMHPPISLIPHETMRHCKIGGDEGYDIYPKTKILINVWAIGRDPNSWENPNYFYPERFENNEIDFRGQHFELLPFGAGRRMCPGLNTGLATVELTLANLLYCFDWELPDGMNREDIVMEEEGGITIHKKTPLYLVPVKYNSQQEETYTT